MNAVNGIKPYKFLDGALAFLVARDVPAERATRSVNEQIEGLERREGS
jgi:hypothetical protein